MPYGASPLNPLGEELRALELRIEALEKSGVGVGKQIKYGSSTAIWTAKGFESALATVTPGFSTRVTVAYGIPINFASFTLAIADFAQPKINFLMRNTTEQALGTEISFFWLAIGE